MSSKVISNTAAVNIINNPFVKKKKYIKSLKIMSIRNNHNYKDPCIVAISAVDV